MIDQPLPTRLDTSLRRALGGAVVSALEDPATVELYRNPDGRVWRESHGAGRVELCEMADAAAEQVLRYAASTMSDAINRQRPNVAATLFGGRVRFQGALPPVVTSPTFVMRVAGASVIPIQTYVERGVMPAGWAQTLRSAVTEKQNVLVAGGTGSGKTTLLNALVSEVTDDRVVTIEDTRELRVTAADHVALVTKPTEPRVSMGELVRLTLRMRPDRILVGEVRGGEALDLVKAWNTGHPGGLGTIHANSAADALQRLEDLIGEVVANVPRRAIAAAVDLVAFIRREPSAPAGRRVTELVRVIGLRSDGEYDVRPLEEDAALAAA
jgi:type IV secretion system protein VirB11